MSLVIFGVGVLIFFISVYGTVVAGGLRLTAEQVGEQPELATDAGLATKQEKGDVSITDIANAKF